MSNSFEFGFTTSKPLMGLSLLICFLFSISVQSQDEVNYTDEVASISKKYDSIWDPSRETIVFTGSSSVRLWHNLQLLFPDHQIVNSGFGGSETHDLLEHLDALILNYHPNKVFIYEGDNDLDRKKRIKAITNAFDAIISKVKENDSTTKMILISTKPSISRWHLKRKYKRLNRKLLKLSEKDEAVQFANVWDVMLEKRKLKRDLFIEDGLHMNEKGYQLWYNVIKNYMD